MLEGRMRMIRGGDERDMGILFVYPFRRLLICHDFVEAGGIVIGRIRSRWG